MGLPSDVPVPVELIASAQFTGLFDFWELSYGLGAGRLLIETVDFPSREATMQGNWEISANNRKRRSQYRLSNMMSDSQ